VAQWRVFADERVLADQAQYVHRHCRQGADQGVVPEKPLKPA
jgi:hypothetical protein